MASNTWSESSKEKWV
ncbi:hypothetical protein S40288_11763 [Stachybotrys chartarum IBT 40288]|nr:hypothetical protein S40288_11763 [Stachybotrys chartarum IBT 40288]